mgnify:CR=1 FL=1
MDPILIGITAMICLYESASFILDENWHETLQEITRKDLIGIRNRKEGLTDCEIQ